MSTTRAAVVVIAAAAFAAPPTPARAAEKYALLVGVNEYQHPNLRTLKYAENDVTELKGVLEKARYKVTVLSSQAGKADPGAVPTRDNILARLRGVLKQCKKDDLVVVALSGHGVQFEDRKDSYFCPVDGSPVRQATASLVSLTAVYDDMTASFAGMKVLLVDACRDDPGAGKGVDADTAPRPPQGVAAIFSCKAGQQAYEVDVYKHGVFFHHVIEGLKGNAADPKGRVTFAGLASHVGQEVPEDVARLIGNGAAQSPNLKADYTTEPVLVAGAGGGRLVPPPVPADPVLADYKAYEKASDAGRRLEYLRREAPNKMDAWRRAAEGGSPTGQFLYASCVLEGVGGAGRDLDASARWFRKAADAGLSRAMSNLGVAYRFGRGVGKDEAEAVRWYRTAADAGSPAGVFNLGCMYQEGVGVAKDEAEARRLFQKSADAGFSMGMVFLGQMTATGAGGGKDAAAAERWFRLASASDQPHTLVRLGRLYASDALGSKNEGEAFRYFQRAAEGGDAGAMNELSVRYAKGLGVSPDETAAAQWCRMAADADDPLAAFNLGIRYEHGRGVAQSDGEAFRCYRRAAEAGVADAMNNLAAMYEDGRGGTGSNLGLAIEWYRKSAAAGCEMAGRSLKRLGVDR